MDFLLNIFSNTLSKFVKGFRKEQVTASLLTGKGEITDIHANVETLNAILKETTNLIELSSVYVSKLSFNVTSFTNLKKKPIEVSIDEIHILMVEPLSFEEGKYDYDKAEWSKKIVTEALKRSSYGLLDRIGDNITLEFNRAYITFQPMGKFKTRRIGPWTPPAISIVLNDFKYVSVDEYGQEGDAIWGHTSKDSKGSQNNEPVNHYVNSERVSRHRTLIIFKKVSMGCSIAIGYMREGMTVRDTFKNGYLLLRNVPIEVQIALHRRISNAAILAVQVDLAVQAIEVELDTSFLPTLVHAVSGLQYCVAKDRHFIDPLVCYEKHDNGLRKKDDPTVQLLEQGTEDIQSETILEEISLQNDDFASDAESEDNDIAPDDFEGEDINISNAEQKPSTIGRPPNFSQTKNKRADFNFQKAENSEDWPAIILPYGILIFEKLCLSVSVHSVALRLRYDSDIEGYAQLSVKGMVGEIIWPQYEEEQGGIVQLSLAYLCLQECNDKSIRTLLIGGTETDWFKSPSQNETSFEEYFPLLEPRPVRNDPFDYRSTFPLQTFGFKASIRVLKEAQSTNVGGRIFVLNEVGINGIEIIFDSDRWGRLSSFYPPEGDSKYDHRWFSGDWNDDITKDMLVFSSTVFDHKEYVQPILDKDAVKKELSSDLINLTAKLSSIKVRIPAPLHEDADSSDVCISFSESMVLISSALPQNFLPENIPGENRVDNEKLHTDNTADLQFPNGLSDLSYDHPHTNTDHNIRIKITLDNFLIEAMPPIPFPKSREPLNIVSSSKLTLLLSLEKENRKPQDIDDLTTLIFLSGLYQDIEINVELGVVSSITSTILYHIEQLSQTLTPYTSMFAIGGEKEHSSSIIFTRLSIMKFDFFLWRHSVSVERGGQRSQAINDLRYQKYIRLLLLLHFHMERIDVGLQLIEHGSTNKLQTRENDYHKVLKASVGKIRLSICDFDSLVGQIDKIDKKSSIIGEGDDSQGSFKKCVDIICFEKGKGTPQPSIASERNVVFATRVESRASFGSPCYSAAIEVSSGEVVLKMNKIYSFVSLMIEALKQVSQLSFSRKIRTWRNNSIISQIAINLRSLSSGYKIETKGSASLQEKINSFFPVNPDFIVMRFCIENVIIAVPRSPTNDDYFGLLFEATSLCAGSFQQKDFSSDKKLMLETPPWRDISCNKSNGLYHVISSRQKCLNINERQNINAGAEIIIDSFTLESNCQPIKWQGLLSECTLTIQDLTVLDELWSCLKSCSIYSAHIQSEVSSMLSTLASISRSECATSDSSKAVTRNSFGSPLIALCQASSDSMKSTTFLFAQIKDELVAFDTKNRLYLEAKQNEIDNLRSLVFKKERDRLSIASLVSNQACGFIRMGGTGLSGQRIVSVTNLWKYWAVLRDSHLIIFKGFSELNPVDYIFMQGAKLRALAGVGRKRDLKLGFVIIDSSGKKRFFLAPSSTDYQMWLHSLSLIIRHLSGEETRTKTKVSETRAKEEINNSGVQSPLLLNAKDGVILEENCFSPDALDTPSQDTNDYPVKARCSSIDTIGTSSLNSNESKKKSVKIKLGSAVHSVFQQKKLYSLNSEDTNPRQASQRTADSEHAPPVQAVGCDDSNHGDDLVSVEEDNASYESTTLDEAYEDSPKHQSKLRLSMSKFGSAVKKVKITDRNTLFPKASSGRKGEVNDDNDLHHSRHSLPEKPLKMTSLRPDVYEPPTKELLYSKKPQIVKRVVGVWDVKVDYDFKLKLNGTPISPSGVSEEYMSTESIKPPEAPSDNARTFRIILTCLPLSESENPSKVTIIKTFSDIVDFHSRISETLYSAEHNFETENINLAEDKAYQDALKNQVITCGNILQGLIEYPDRSNKYLIQCVSDSLATFIGCLLSNCLPENVYDIVIAFLKLRSTIIDQLPLDDAAHYSFDDVSENKREGIALPSEYMNLMNKCESELIKSNYHILKAKVLASVPDRSQSTEESQMETRIDSASSSNIYNEAIQEALAAVMAERDEAHVQLLASRVIHSHEMEIEKRRVLVLQEKVDYAKRFYNADSAAAAKFFLGQEEVPGKDSLGKIEKEMVQDTDKELLALCNQLSSEISLRVAAELEILRLKERRKIEHDAEIAERALLRDEAQHCRKRLEEEIQRRQLAENEKRTWEKSFQQIINNSDASV